ncbi:MAG TPA: hypothetical protein VGT44_19525 [Ktedonobacteraceae bacterium]|nr:hypothetical protein [Ktedonobacteraceae bacterium]
MNELSTEENKHMSSVRMSATSAYSARIQEAMRQNKLRTSDYSLVMSIMRAISYGDTEEKWKTEQQRAVKSLLEEPTDKKMAHAEAANLYEQTIAGLQELVLWPW